MPASPLALREDWASFGPQGHAFEPLYRAAAQRMINQATAVMDGESLVAERSVTLPRTGAVITCRADHIQLTPQGVMVRRLKTSRLANSETEKARYVLWQAAVRIDHPDLPVEFEHVSLVTGDRQTATLDPGKIPDGLRKIEAAIEAVNAGRFQPAPSDRCPTCPHYFVCPTHGTTR